jgi:HEAT repeat protein
LQGADRIIALLGAAVSEDDHTRIKECLDQLVAMGDAAVIPLHDLVGTEGETALWAAEALARIGTPTATSALLNTLAQTKEGPYKEELGKRVAGISNHDSWPILMDSIMQSSDATVLRAAGTALARMADTPIVDALVANYEAAATDEMAQRLTQLISNIQSPKATEALLALAGNTSAAPQDDLQRAALDALARIGDPQAVSHLLRRLETAAPGQGTEIFNAIARIESPAAHIPLLYAAAGNKEVSSEGRTAAIYALKNYPSEKTIALLEAIIAQEDNDRVRSAATRTLDDLRMAPHAVTAKSDPTVKEDHILPPLPEKK